MEFKDRADGGRFLIPFLKQFTHNAVVVSLARGGILTGIPIARSFSIPFFILVIRKLGVPGFEEQGFGAIDPDGRKTLNHSLVRHLGLTDQIVESVAKKEMVTLRQRLQVYNHEPPNLTGKTVIVVDDGLATGYTMEAALKYLQTKHPAKVIVAVPYGHVHAIQLITKQVDTLICPNVSSEPSFAVGMAYSDFHDLSDEEVLQALTELD